MELRQVAKMILEEPVDPVLFALLIITNALILLFLLKISLT